MKDLYKLKKTEYQQGAETCLSNAKDHLHIAKVSAENNCSGIGTSHLVIACEELCKASILRIKSLDHKVPVLNLNKYFTDHRLKHENIFKLLDTAQKFEKNRISSERNKKSPQDTSIGTGVSAIIAIFILYFIFKKTEKPKSEGNRKSSERSFMEQLRVQGFYVDLNEERVWTHPNTSIPMDNFQVYFEIAEDLFKKIEDHLFNRQPTQQELGELHVELGNLKKHINDAATTDS